MRQGRPVAVFSPCRRYRYTLWREWIGGDGYAMVVGLNPSTADEVQNDPTVRRCIAYAKSWGFGGLCMTNLFAFRATDPQDMKAVADPIGPDNDRHLLDCARHAGVVVAAWGEHGVHLDRAAAVTQLLGDLHYLRMNQSGQPGHPLYLPKALRPVRWIRT
jgi:hypothetical protein